MNIFGWLTGKAKEKTMGYLQQGDVILTPVEVIPATERNKLGHKTLADGEVSGHHHVAEAEDVELFEEDGILYMRAPHGTTVRHEEHKPVTVPPGNYKIGRVREMDHLAQPEHQIRTVID